MFPEVKLIVGAVVAFILLGAGVWGAVELHHHGFVAGQNERTAHYEPLMTAANKAKDAADLRVARAEKAADAISTKSEEDHASFAKTLADRESAADDRIAGILRQRAAANTAARGSQLSGVAGAASAPAGTSAGSGLDNGDSGRIPAAAGRMAAIGERCEHDASEVSDFQRWYAEQRANSAAAVNP